MFRVGQEAIEQYLEQDDWHFWVSMHQGSVTMPVFQVFHIFLLFIQRGKIEITFL